VEDRPINEVEDGRFFLLMVGAEVLPNAGQPGEGSELCWELMSDSVSAHRDAHSAGGEKGNGGHWVGRQVEVRGCNFIAPLV
jgi:hypothetical protein